MVRIPAQLAENVPYWMGERGRAWLAALPDLVAECETRWRIRVGPVFEDGGAVSWVAPATLHDGTEAVVKLFVPDIENRHEAEGLQHYDGRGAVRLLEHADGVLLLERARPGTPLWDVADEDAANSVVAGLLRQLWRPAPARSPHRRLVQVAEAWSTEIPATWESLGRPFERSLVERAVEAAATLGPDQGEQVLLHQDLHGENVLAAQREPWLAIDPKPLSGEREFAVAPIVRSFELGHGKRDARYRLDRLTAELGLDRQRARGWTIAQTVAWSGGSDYIGTHLETVRWLLEDA
jgi:streptomycin 6-kinase